MAYVFLAAHQPIWAYESIGIPLFPFSVLMVILSRSKSRAGRTDGLMPQPPEDYPSGASGRQPPNEWGYERDK
ncbi:MAG: hypothetical protein ACP5O1_04950 [Phycisphaerae bacterium]